MCLGEWWGLLRDERQCSQEIEFKAKPRQSRGAISPTSILSESRNHPNCVHWRILYFMWLRRIYEFLCIPSNPIWKGRNFCDYRPSHLTLRKYFRPFWFSRYYVVVAYCNRRMCNLNVQGSVSTNFFRPTFDNG